MLKPDKWQATFDRDGKIFGFQKVLKSIVLGGVDPSIRPEVWEFLLGCYELSSTDEYRKLLRSARRERYNELVDQCRMMHSSVGTGSLAYVVGSKVMDMRTSSKDEGTKVEPRRSRGDYDDYASNLGTYSNEFNNAMDISSKIECLTDSDDPISVSNNASMSDPYRYSSMKNCTEAYESNYKHENVVDFPPLPVTDLFDKRKNNRKGHHSLDDGIYIRRRLRFGDHYVHSFRISNNADLVVENNNLPDNYNLMCRKSDSEICLDFQDPMCFSNNFVHDSRMLDNFRISDAPESTKSASNVAISQGAITSEVRVSEWIWTLHRIVVDVVRTDSHLEFYEDSKNLARMSDILAVYAWVDPATGYCQGMSDLLSPFVVLFEDNGDAFWCFEMLLRRLRENFQMEGPIRVMKQLQALWHILELTNKELFSHLSQIGDASLHFAFRMLLVLFRRELSFNESLCMWEMLWAADFDQTMVSHLTDHCSQLLALQITKEAQMEMGETIIDMGISSSKNGTLEHPPVYDNRALKTVSARPFCGLNLTNNFWSKNEDDLLISNEMSTTGNGDDELSVFCVAAILITNRQKIIRETKSLEDLIKIFNDKVLKFRVKRCIRSAIKLRKKYFYKRIKIRTESIQIQE